MKKFKNKIKIKKKLIFHVRGKCRKNVSVENILRENDFQQKPFYIERNKGLI
jgi:hypothetical protein